MEGIEFVRGEHISFAKGCYLPFADLLGHISHHLHSVCFDHPRLKQYLPSLLEVDLFVTWDEDRFILLVSPEKRGHLPARGMEMDHLPAQREAGNDFFHDLSADYTDISGNAAVRLTFDNFGFAPGFAAAGVYPAKTYSPEAKDAKAEAGRIIAALMQRWAEERRRIVEASRIFLSHKGVNKPLIERIDSALRVLSLKTWFDREDLAAGDVLLRGVDGAFSGCAAAVFFISEQYVDEGVIMQEIDRALHEKAMRKDGFSVIPLVLRQHGGSDDHVPTPLQTLVWKTVDDVEIVPTILRALPETVRASIRYQPPK